jgi:thymidylate synthase (FAD)
MSDAISFIKKGNVLVTVAGLTPDAELHIERCARFCYDSLDKMKLGSHIGFLRGAIKRGHFSILSHAHCTFFIEGISRACSHQLVRHAHLRYLQRSQRYCSEDTPQYVLPESFSDLQSDINDNSNWLFKHGMRVCWEVYKLLAKWGAKKEDARFVLPNACVTQMAVSGTLQGWWDFLRLRLDKHAQWEIRDVAKTIYELLHTWAPNIFTPELLVIQPKLNLEFPNVD